tara:strand:+ start:4563 stop:4781 length:219 start_codon:yes stop_codon:yes gene_type:complete
VELVFTLVTYLGFKTIDETFFRSIDDCKYFAERINNQPPVPNKIAGEGISKIRKYVAVCEPRKVDSEKNKVY